MGIETFKFHIIKFGAMKDDDTGLLSKSSMKFYKLKNKAKTK